jgi:tetratricopeptide (TPR) repeat protein
MPENNSSSPSQQEQKGTVNQLVSAAWKFLQFCSVLFAIVIAGYAVWDAKTPVTTITAFQVPKNDLPFTGEIVADAVQDGLKSIRNEIEQEKQDGSVRSWETGLPALRNVLIPRVWRVQAPPRFTVEVKGVSYERILSVARGVMGTETTISGDVIFNKDKFTLVARSAQAGPWKSIESPTTAEGLQQASRDLAEKILVSLDPTVAGMMMLKNGRIDDGLAVLNRARNMNPIDPRFKLNLCAGLGATRRYDEAIECYKEVLNQNRRSAPEVWGRLAQIYYLRGDQVNAIKEYEESRRRGDEEALLGLGEVLDVSNRHQDALNAFDEFLRTEHGHRNLAVAHVKRSAALAHLGRRDEALAEYQEALKYAPRDLLVLVHQSVALAESGDVEAAIARLESLVKENSDNTAVPFAHLQLGQLLATKGDWRDACEHYWQAAREPNYVEAHLKLAEALVHVGDPAGALAEYTKVANLSPSDVQRGYSEAFAYQWLGNTLRDMNDYSGAAWAYRQALARKSDYGAAHCELGVMLAKQGHVEDAIQHYGAALLPAKLKELSDSECLVTAQQQLEQVLAKAQSHGAEDAFAFRRARHVAQPVAAHEVAGRYSDAPKLFDQPMLRSGAQRCTPAQQRDASSACTDR